MRAALVFLVSLLTLAACGSDAATASATFTPQTIVPPPTPTPTLVPTVTQTATATAIPSETPIPTATAIATQTPPQTATPLPGLLQVAVVNASAYDQTGSNDAGGNLTGFLPENVVDGDPTTAWRVRGNGLNQWIELRFNDPVVISEIGVIPGYAKTDPFDGTNRFTQNYVIRDARFEFSDGSVQDVSFDYLALMQFARVNDVISDFVRIVILSTFEPTYWDPRLFTPISEVEVRGWGR